MSGLFWAGIVIAVLALIVVVALALGQTLRTRRREDTEQFVKTRLTDGEREVITALALGHVESHHEAVEIYRANLGMVNRDRDLHMRYMSEVDNISPDYVLMSDYRRAIVNEYNRNKAAQADTALS